jgi:2-C-methyl-D-erythritol 4-phosphate cytidylyltransferase
MSIVALLPAAGSGSRMADLAANSSKVSLELRPGVTLLHSALSSLARSGVFDRYVIAARPEDHGELSQIAAQALDLSGAGGTFDIISGADTRQGSVRCLLEYVKGEASVVAVHDAARPFPDPAAIRTAVSKAVEAGGAVLASRLVSTLKREVAGGEIIKETISREGLWEAQTPQCFRFDLLWEAHSWAKENDFIGTDECSVVEAIGGKIVLVESSRQNIKVTTPEDLQLARALECVIPAE